jgi:dihydrofolate synthase / folylpolyglutamate synthase
LSRDRYRRALARLYALESKGVKLGLERMEEALARRGHPERGLRCVHVGGTNGKGSVSALVERALREAGYRTGQFSSPHLHRWVERVRVGGEPLDEDEASRRIESVLDDPGLAELSFFEATTLIAFEAFRDAGCDPVVLEVGLGGRLDSTNVVRPLVSVVTNVSLEHTQILGETIEAIAAEKAGIFKPGVPAVVGAAGAARDLLVRLAEAKGAVPRVAREAGPPSGLGGPHAEENARVAYEAIRALRDQGVCISDEAVERGFSLARWAGRFERVAEAPEVWVDAGHNPAGCEALARHLRGLEARPTVLLFGAMEDKDLLGMLAPFDEVAEARVYALPPMRRAGDVSRLAAVRDGIVAASVEEGLARAVELAGSEGRVVVCGSIFLVAEVRARILGVPADPPIGM